VRETHNRSLGLSLKGRWTGYLYGALPDRGVTRVTLQFVRSVIELEVWLWWAAMVVLAGLLDARSCRGAE
jgi:hypothetical protein